MTLSYAQACATLKRLLEEEERFIMDVGSKGAPASLHIIPFEEGYWAWLDTPDFSVEHVYPHNVRIYLTEVKFMTQDGTTLVRWGLNIVTPSSDGRALTPSMTIYIDEGQEIFGRGVCE